MCTVEVVGKLRAQILARSSEGREVKRGKVDGDILGVCVGFGILVYMCVCVKDGCVMERLSRKRAWAGLM
jgi:hypothetical protein